MADDIAVQARRREIVVEHVLFTLVEYVEAKRAGLLGYVEGSLDPLRHRARHDTKGDEAIRVIARRLVASARREGSIIHFVPA